MNGRSSYTVLIAVIAAIALIPMGILVFARTAPSSAQAANVGVSCGPGFRAEVRQVMNGGVPRVTVDCAYEPSAEAALPTQMWSGPQAGIVPAVYSLPTAAAPARMTPGPVRQVRQTRSVTPARKKSSWQQHALIIGGSAGTGAGIGAIAGGKKGALIGAAIGGGGAALVQAVRNR
jgi:hypothetical protein